MRFRSYYQVLMVDPSADAEIIAVVHRRLAQRYHPDVATRADAGARMLDINEAWDTLRDPERRRRYDAQLALRRDRRSGDRNARPTAPVPGPVNGPVNGRPSWGEAGQPSPGPQVGPVLEFGRYRGWTLHQIAT